MSISEIQAVVSRFALEKSLCSDVMVRVADLLCIANVSDTNLEECLYSVLEKYEKRFIDKGNIGSDATQA